MPNTPADAPRFDYIVVGAGTAGCLLANRLSADPRVRVLLIEAGSHDAYVWIHIPVGYLYCIGNPRTDWLFNTDPDPGLNGRSLRYPRGKVLGGCTSINGMIYMRGQSRDYDGWAAAVGDDAWTWRSCLPHFLRHEDHWRGADEWHAAPGFDRRGRRAGGEYRVERQRLSWQVLDAFALAAQQAGIPAQRRLQSRQQRGRGLLRGQPAGRRALEREQGLSAPGAAPAQPAGVDRRARQPAAVRRRARAARARRRGGARGCGAAGCACRARGGARRRRHRFAAAAAAVGHRAGRAAASRTAWRRASSAPASARTCRTTCRFAPCSRCRACARSTRWPTRGWAKPASACSTCCRAAGR